MIIIDYAVKSDIKSIQLLDKSVIKNDSRFYMIRACVTEGNSLVAKIDHVAAGFLIFSHSFFHQHFIDLIIVDTSFRRRGIGLALLDRYTTHIGSGKVFTSTNESNIIMQGLLDKAGFERSGIIYNLDEGDPELIYYKLNPLPSCQGNYTQCIKGDSLSSELWGQRGGYRPLSL